MSEGMDIEAVGRTLQRLLGAAGRPIVLQDEVSGAERRLSPESAAAADGLLPAFLVAGEAVWREATGSGFGLEVERDEEALLGYRVTRIGEPKFSAVMLSMMEATAQAVRDEAIVVNALGLVWEDATRRAEMHERAAGGVGGSQEKVTPAATGPGGRA